MSFLSRKPARPGSRDGDAGRDDEYDDYDLYSADRYQGEGDDGWNPGEYFSPEGIKGRWAGENPEGRSGGRGGRRDNGRGDAAPGYDGFDGPPQRGDGPPQRASDGPAQRGAPRGGGPDLSRTEAARRDPARPGVPRDDFPRAASPSTGGYPAYGGDEYPSGAYELPDGADEDRPSAGRRKRRDREDRSDWTGILRLRRDRGEDIWPDDGISDEDYWASVAADRPLTEPGSPADTLAKGGPGSRPPAAARPAGADARFGPGQDRDPRGGARDNDLRGPDQRGADLRGPDQRGADQRGPDQRGADQRGPDQRGADQPGRAGRLGPPPGLASDRQPAAAAGGSAAGGLSAGSAGSAGGPATGGPATGSRTTGSHAAGGRTTGSHAASGQGQPGGSSWPGAGSASARPASGPNSFRPASGPNSFKPASGPNSFRPGAGPSTSRPGTGANPARPGTGASPTVGVTVSRPPAGSRPGSAGGPATGPHPAWPGQPAKGRASGGFPQAPARPSFQPNGRPPAAAGTGSRPAADRGDWGERTERIDRVTAAGYPEARPGSRSQGQATGHHAAMGPGSAGPGRPPVPPVPPVPSAPAASPATAGAASRALDALHSGDTGFWQNEERALDRRDNGRDSNRETGGSIWSVPARDSAPARGNDDPLTSSAYSRSALGETDGRSYRVAARRSQAQTKLTDQTESFAAAQYQSGQYQSGQYRAGSTGEYPAAAFPSATQRTGEHRQYRGEPAGSAGSAGSAHDATVRYPAHGSQQAHQPQHSRSQPGTLSQPALGQPPLGQPPAGQPTVSQPALSQPGFGPGHGPGNGQGYPGQPGRAAAGGSRPGLPGGGSAGTGPLDNGLPANSLPVNGLPGSQYDAQQNRSAQQRPPSRPPAAPQPSAAAPLSAPVPSSSTGIPGNSRPTAPGGPNPYDTGATGSYPYPGSQAYQDRPAAPTPAPANGTDDRYYRPQPPAGYPAAPDQGRPDQPRPEQQARPAHPGYANGNPDRRERPY